MSRPFSYNDENFTVIDNLLFCHIKINKEIQIGESIVEVPPAIFNRLLCTTANLTRQLDTTGTIGGYIVYTGIKEENGKHYIYADTLINGKVYKYLTGIYYLKDI